MRILAGVAVALISGGWMLARRWAGGSWRLLPLLLLVPALVFAGNEVRWYRFEAALADAAAPALGAREAAFHWERLTRNFWSSQGYVGHVWFSADGVPDDEAFLSGETCDEVRSWRRHPDHPSLREIVAVHTVTHEAYHLVGERREAVAECRAAGSDKAVMVRLGASPGAAHAAVLRYLAEVYPKLPDDYRSGSCDLEAVARPGAQQ